MFDILEADIVVMQETKIQRKDLTDDMVLLPGWDVFFTFPKYKKGTLVSPDTALCQTANPGYPQVTLESQSIHETPNVPQSELKKGSLVF